MILENHEISEILKSSQQNLWWGDKRGTPQKGVITYGSFPLGSSQSFLLTLVVQLSLHGRQRLPLTCSGNISSTATAEWLASSSFGSFPSVLVCNILAS